MDKFGQLVNLCKAHTQRYTSGAALFQLEFVTKFLQLGDYDLRRFAEYMARYPQNGDGA